MSKFVPLLAQLESAKGHAAELSPYTLDALLADSAHAIAELQEEVDLLRLYGNKDGIAEAEHVLEQRRQSAGFGSREGTGGER